MRMKDFEVAGRAMRKRRPVPVLEFQLKYNKILIMVKIAHTDVRRGFGRRMVVAPIL